MIQHYVLSVFFFLSLNGTVQRACDDDDDDAELVLMIEAIRMFVVEVDSNVYFTNCACAFAYAYIQLRKD